MDLKTSSCTDEPSSPGKAVVAGKLGGRSSRTLPGCRAVPEASAGLGASKAPPVGCKIGAPSAMMGAKPMGIGAGAGAGVQIGTGQEQLHCIAKTGNHQTCAARPPAAGQVLLGKQYTRREKHAGHLLKVGICDRCPTTCSGNYGRGWSRGS